MTGAEPGGLRLGFYALRRGGSSSGLLGAQLLCTPKARIYHVGQHPNPVLYFRAPRNPTQALKPRWPSHITLSSPGRGPILSGHMKKPAALSTIWTHLGARHPGQPSLRQTLWQTNKNTNQPPFSASQDVPQPTPSHPSWNPGTFLSETGLP